MAIIKEVLDALGDVTDAIGNIRKISKAVSDGKNYLITTHPEVTPLLIALCEEMNKTLKALKEASSIITDFRFVLGDDLSGEARKFNDYFIAHKTKAENVRQQIKSMRGHCHIIKQHADDIENGAKAKGLRSLFSIFGIHSEEKEQELSNALDSIYNDELALYKTVSAMEFAINKTMDLVESQLGPVGIIEPNLIPEAAKVLGEYVIYFKTLERDTTDASDELEESVDILRDV